MGGDEIRDLGRTQARLAAVAATFQAKDHFPDAPAVAIVEQVAATVEGLLFQLAGVQSGVVLGEKAAAFGAEPFRVVVAGHFQGSAMRELGATFHLGLPGAVDGEGGLLHGVGGGLVLGQSPDDAADAGVDEDLGGGALFEETLQQGDLVLDGVGGVGEFLLVVLDPFQGDDAGELEEGLLPQLLGGRHPGKTAPRDMGRMGLKVKRTGRDRLSGIQGEGQRVNGTGANDSSRLTEHQEL